MQTKIEISPEIVQKCQKFGEECVLSNLDKYRSRNQFDKGKIIADIKCGKIGEYVIWNHLLNKFPNLSEPDINIYVGNKSWDADLIDKSQDLKVAVKSQDYLSSCLYGDSWVFQYNKGKKYDCDTGIFGNQEDKYYVSFVSLNVPKKTAIIRGVVKVSWLHKNNLFKEMKKENLKGNKVAVYLEDLEKFSRELFQL